VIVWGTPFNHRTIKVQGLITFFKLNESLGDSEMTSIENAKLTKRVKSGRSSRDYAINQPAIVLFFNSENGWLESLRKSIGDLTGVDYRGNN